MSTGRGEFPQFNYENTTGKTLAVISPLGDGAEELRGTFLVHLDRAALRARFRSVKTVSRETIESVLGENYAGERISRRKGRELAEATDADLILAFWVHDYVVKRFSTTKIRTLYTTKTSRANTTIFTTETEPEQEGEPPGRGRGPGQETSGAADTEPKETESENSYVATTKTKTQAREIPVESAQNRVVLSVTALIYDVQQERVIWEGKRIERAEAAVESRSILELTDIAAERIMNRVNGRLNP